MVRGLVKIKGVKGEPVDAEQLQFKAIKEHKQLEQCYINDLGISGEPQIRAYANDRGNRWNELREAEDNRETARLEDLIARKKWENAPEQKTIECLKQEIKELDQRLRPTMSDGFVAGYEVQK